jgi:hypothetical protein
MMMREASSKRATRQKPGGHGATVEMQEDEIERLHAVVDAARDEHDADSALVDALDTYDRFTSGPKP